VLCGTSSSSLLGMHHQCVAPLAANSPHSGLSRAISIASSKVRLCRDRSFFRVAIQEEWGRPTGLLQSLWRTAVRILLASADSSILIRWPNSTSLLFCMIQVRRGCSVRRRTSQLETRWYRPAYMYGTWSVLTGAVVIAYDIRCTFKP